MLGGVSRLRALWEVTGRRYVWRAQGLGVVAVVPALVCTALLVGQDLELIPAKTQPVQAEKCQGRIRRQRPGHARATVKIEARGSSQIGVPGT